MTKQDPTRADYGDNAAPAPDYPADHKGARPDPGGSFLLIMRSKHVSGGLWMRRYATKDDAVTVAANYTGAQESWLFEVSGEVDLEAERSAFWERIEI